MTFKSIERIFNPPTPHMVGDGFRVHNFFPSGTGIGMLRMSPFILLDYNSKFHFPPTDQPRGVGVHPHRGFETVTIAYHGKVAHHDSAGNSGVIGEGDVQWMTAASGVLHKEYHEENFSRAGGDFQMVQLWVNLPAKDKMSAPKYQEISKDKISKFVLPDNGGTIEVIAGTYQETKGPALTFTPLELQNARLNKGGKATFSFPASYNTGMVIVEGSIKVNDTEMANADQFVLFGNDGENITIEALEDAVILVLSGAPINEPLVSYGPFVMNTKGQITEAIQDVNMGKFGYLEV